MSAVTEGVRPADLRDPVRYWELRRIVYNLILSAAAIAWVALTWPHFRPAFTWRTIPPLAFLVAMANLCYCAVYGAELTVRALSPAGTWRHWRLAIFIAGTLLALLLESYWIADEIYPYLPYVG